MKTPGIIDYERLVEDYHESLLTTLRGFRAGEWSYLDAWVPDVDDAKGLVGLIEAVKDAGKLAIVVYIGPTTIGAIDMPGLQSTLRILGEFVPEVRGDGLLLRLSFSRDDESNPSRAAGTDATPLGQPKGRNHRRRAQNLPTSASADDHVNAAADELPLIYRDGLQTVAANCSHEGCLGTADNRVRVTYTTGGVELSALVNRESHEVVRAAYRGELSGDLRGLLEALCLLGEGRPLQDWVENGTVCVEHTLRDPEKARPVSGIVLPERVFTGFKILANLLQGLLADYSRVTGFAPLDNFFEPPVSDAWRRLSRTQRKKKLEEASNSHPAGMGVTVAQSPDARRALVTFQDDLDSIVKHDRIVQLELYLKQTLDPSLQLLMERKTDQNAIRRLKEAN